MQGGIGPTAGAEPAAASYCQYVTSVWPQACDHLNGVLPEIAAAWDRAWTGDATLQDCVVLGAVAAGAALLLRLVIRGLFALLRELWFSVNPAARYQSRTRRSAGTRDLPIHTLSSLERWWIWWFVLTRWSRYMQANAVVPLAHKSKGRYILKRDTVDQLNQIQSVERPDALILRGAFRAPFSLEKQTRDGIKREGIEHKWVQQAMKRAVCIMGNIGYVPLPDRYNEGTPNYIFRAKAIEECRDTATLQGRSTPNQPHKLFYRPATVLPHLPFGPTLESGRFDSIIAPDAVAFIFMDRTRRKTKLGPLIYFLHRLQAALGPANMGLLKEKIFQIIPDQDIRDNPFGGTDAIALFGEAAESHQKFMRIDYTRIEPVPSTPQRDRARSAIAALKRVLDIKADRRYAEPAPLDPGDLLVLNNWRAATAWDDECGGITGWGGVHVHAGDRIVFQMNFYRPREETPGEDENQDDDHGGGHH